MATGAPGTNGVWQYGEDDSEATFSALLNKAASTTDTQIGADRTRLTALEAKPLSGLVPIVPSSVDKSGGTATANSLGQVTFTGVSSVSLNGVFSSSYSSYKIVARAIQSSAEIDVWFRLRLSGTDETGTSYANNGPLQNGSTLSGFLNNAATRWLICGTPAGTFGLGSIDMTLHNVGSATNWKTFTSLASGYGGGNIKSFWQNGYNSNGNIAYNGFSLIPSSGTFTGTIQVFGYND